MLYSEVKKLAFGVLEIFGSTYSCELRSQLTNKNLESCLKQQNFQKTCKANAPIDWLLKILYIVTFGSSVKKGFRPLLYLDCSIHYRRQTDSRESCELNFDTVINAKGLSLYT
ncbi:General transcription factor ii-i repeat domain-containing protein 2-like protein [Aphis craccivora]|uniref:General transcription factor ii-i repeat domain-containing protein 2-like protein n=1 Tax=Aphis craccivora TaxID=307492 RepID=A0A6G0YSA8_APHCR|nr:General transcription factor ii-i repeat domain-containing protein 2-like protein [Aphis craccivora]